MKNISKFIFFISAFLYAVTGFAATTSKVTVNGMVCAFCAQGIEKRLSQLPEAQAIFVDLKNKIVAVQAKEGMSLDEKKIRAEITDAGYDVVKIESITDSVAEIKAQMGAKK